MAKGEKIGTKIKREKNYLYFIDKEGEVRRVKRKGAK